MYTDGTKPHYSVTTILGGIFGKGKFFDTWLKNLGHYADIYTKARMQRGTLVHEILHLMKQDGQCVVDFSFIKDFMHDFVDASSIAYWKGKNALADSVMKYIESYEKWTLDYDIKYWGSEVMLYNPDYDWAGAVDDPIQNKTLNCNQIVDIKTGGAYDTHILQCIAYALLWNKLYPQHQMTSVGVLYIKDSFVTKPTYKFETLELDSTKGKKKIQEWEHTMAIWRLRHANADGSYPVKQFYQPKEEVALRDDIEREFLDPINQE